MSLLRDFFSDTEINEYLVYRVFAENAEEKSDIYPKKIRWKEDDGFVIKTKTIKMVIILKNS